MGGRNARSLSGSLFLQVTASGPSRQQAARARVSQQPMQTLCFRDGHGPSDSRQPVVATPLIVVFRVGPLSQFFDESLFEQPPDGGVEAAGAEAEGTIRPFQNVLHDGIPVPVAIGERHQDVEGVAVQREE